MESYTWMLGRISECLTPVRIYLLAITENTKTITTVFTSGKETITAGTQYHLLITTNDFNNKNSDTLQENIQAKCSPRLRLTSWITHEEDFLKGISNHDFFSSHTFRYATALLLPEENTLPIEIIDESLIKPDPSCYINRAEQFISTTRLLLLHKQPTIASFQLHQAAEQFLSAVILDSTGFRPPTHNLSRLLAYARFYKPALCMAFSNSPEEERCLQQLQKAYISSRYNNDFSMQATPVERLLEKINTMIVNFKKGR